MLRLSRNEVVSGLATSINDPRTVEGFSKGARYLFEAVEPRQTAPEVSEPQAIKF